MKDFIVAMVLVGIENEKTIALYHKKVQAVSKEEAIGKAVIDAQEILADNPLSIRLNDVIEL